ncbi:MAG: hypothetical protein ACR2OE_16440 [Thermomicrobiales bacterium]
MFNELDSINHSKLTGFAVGLSFGLIFAVLSPNEWWLGLIGGLLLGVLTAKLFASDAARDQIDQDLERRLSRRPRHGNAGSEHDSPSAPSPR